MWPTNAQTLPQCLSVKLWTLIFLGTDAPSDHQGVSVELPPPLPPPCAPPSPVPSIGGSSRGSRAGGPEAVRVYYGGGTITYYGPPLCTFVGFCRKHGDRCRLTRTSNADHNYPAKGRPLAAIMSWLADVPDSVETKREHVMGYEPSFLVRSMRRREISTLSNESDDWNRLSAAERPQRDGEGVEPTPCP